MVPTRKGLQNLLQQLEATRAVLPANIPTEKGWFLYLNF